MKYMVILCTAAAALLIVAGCSQIFPPLPAPATPLRPPARQQPRRS